MAADIQTTGDTQKVCALRRVSRETTMRKPLTRDEEVDLMVNAAKRAQACMAKWLSVPVIRHTILHGDQADAGAGYSSELKVRPRRSA